MATSAAPPPPPDGQMADDRLESCFEVAAVGDGSQEAGGILVCSLLAGHDGYLHWDNADRIWWAVRA